MFKNKFTLHQWNDLDSLREQYEKLKSKYAEHNIELTTLTEEQQKLGLEGEIDDTDESSDDNFITKDELINRPCK